MGLESKAKTTHELWVDEEYAEDKFDNMKWVQLEEAQKLEIENKKLKSKLDRDCNGLAIQLEKMTNKCIALENQKSQANKILDEINSPLTLDFIRIDRLREALK